MSKWTAYGGSWQPSDGGVTNTSNESGSRLQAGDEAMTDYRLDSDLRLTNSNGDAGLAFRITDPEEGTNSFYGYYAAVRRPNLLVLARMDYGFQPLMIVPIEQGVTPGVWYHLIVEAQGCRLTAELRDERNHILAHAADTDTEECQRHGSFGLRSFASGGSWRNLTVGRIR